jgi:CelD/BcsL family acetyltransferase involved in cellulose biosynthesis
MRINVLPPLTRAAAPAISDALTCETHVDFEALTALRAEWDSFVERVGGDVYFSFDWCRTWWKHYAYRRRLCILVFRAAGELVGILPMFVDRLWLGPVPVRLAKFVGSDSAITVLNPPIEPRRAVEVLSAALRELLNHQHCDAVAFAPLSGERPHARAIRAACDAVAPLARLARDRITTVYNVYKLPSDGAAYLPSLPRTPRRDYERGWRKLTADNHVQTETITGAEALPAYEEFIRLHTQQWQALNKLGHFGDWPRSTEFNRDLLRALAPQQRAGFHIIRANGQTVSSADFLRFGAHEHWRRAARDVRPRWNRANLGVLVQVRATEAAVEAGIARVEDGPGRYEYKTAMGAVEYPLSSLLVSRGLYSRLKVAVLSRISDLFHLLYYRIWFGRIAPRLPFRRRGLSVAWTRYHT